MAPRRKASHVGFGFSVPDVTSDRDLVVLRPIPDRSALHLRYKGLVAIPPHRSLARHGLV